MTYRCQKMYVFKKNWEKINSLRPFNFANLGHSRRATSMIPVQKGGIIVSS